MEMAREMSITSVATDVGRGTAVLTASLTRSQVRMFLEPKQERSFISHPENVTWGCASDQDSVQGPVDK